MEVRADSRRPFLKGVLVTVLGVTLGATVRLVVFDHSPPSPGVAEVDQHRASLLERPRGPDSPAESSVRTDTAFTSDASSGADDETPAPGPVLQGNVKEPAIDPELIAAWRVVSAPPRGHVRLVEARTRVSERDGSDTASHDLVTWQYWWEGTFQRLEGLEQTRIRAGSAEIVIGPKRIPFVVRAEDREASGAYDEPFVWLRWVSRLLPRLTPDASGEFWSGFYPVADPWHGRRWAPILLPRSTVTVVVDKRLGIPTSMTVRAPGDLSDKVYTRFSVAWFVGESGRVLPRRVGAHRATALGSTLDATIHFEWSFPDDLGWDKRCVMEVRQPVIVDARRDEGPQDRYEVVLERNEDYFAFDVRTPDKAFAELAKRIDQPWIEDPATIPAGDPGPGQVPPGAAAPHGGVEPVGEDVLAGDFETRAARGRVPDPVPVTDRDAEVVTSESSPVVFTLIGLVLAAIGVFVILRARRRS